jgi:hypothetical protein
VGLSHSLLDMARAVEFGSQLLSARSLAHSFTSLGLNHFATARQTAGSLRNLRRSLFC